MSCHFFPKTKADLSNLEILIVTGTEGEGNPHMQLVQPLSHLPAAILSTCC